MKILYVISCNGSGIGGHYNSLDHVSRALAEVAQVKIISIGLTESPLLIKNPFYHGKLKFNWYSLFSLNKPLKKILSKFNADVIHCFDGGAALMLMALPAVWNRHLIYTKCGGPNERKSVAQVLGSVILFSSENYYSYMNNPRFKRSSLYLIPNRVFSVDLLPERDRTISKTPDVFTFVRIARIGKTYLKSIKQSIELIRRLTNRVKVRLIIIGQIDNKEIFFELKQSIINERLPVTFITDKVTYQASKMLYLADAVIGTGRGVMEAMVIGLPVLVPNKLGNLPSLLNKENFNDYFITNFSERSISGNTQEDDTLSKVKLLIRDKNFYKSVSHFSESMGYKYFKLNKKVCSNYIKIYKSELERTTRCYICYNIIPFIYYINAYRRVIKRNRNLVQDL